MTAVRLGTAHAMASVSKKLSGFNSHFQRTVIKIPGVSRMKAKIMEMISRIGTSLRERQTSLSTAHRQPQLVFKDTSGGRWGWSSV